MGMFTGSIQGEMEVMNFFFFFYWETAKLSYYVTFIRFQFHTNEKGAL